MTHSPVRALVAALAASLLALALCASAASAEFGVARVTNEVETPVAAAHTTVRTTIDFRDAGDETADSVRDLRLKLAPGVVAYVDRVPECSLARFAVDRRDRPADCAGSQVGETSTTASTDNALLSRLEVKGAIYNLEPAPGTPAAFGIDIEVPLAPRLKLIAPIAVDPNDLGLTATLSGLPNETRASILGLPVNIRLHIDQIVQTLYGEVGRRGFFTNPTSCGETSIGATATSHGGATGAGSGSWTTTDCDSVPFNPTLVTTANPATPDSTSAISFNVSPGEGTEERVASHVRTTTVIAPPGTLLNSSLAAGLDACTDEGFRQQDTSVAANCPASSEVGSIEFVSPILGPFPGKVYFGTQTPTDRLRLFLDVPLFGAHIKVSARVNPDPRTGQVTTVFSDLPQIAFTSFRLTFNGGPRSALVTPTTCGRNTSQAIVGPWAGNGERTPTAIFETTGTREECERRFTPSLGLAVSNPQAGGETSFTLSFDRPDRTIPVGRVAFDLPPGLIGSLALRGLVRCSLQDAANGSCPAASRVGSVASVVGSGSEPPTLNGNLYFTEPRVAGDVAGLMVDVPARLGPVDAGVVRVGQRLLLGNDGGLDVISDPIPALQFGIPLAIRRLTVTVDRRGFMRNPHTCGDRAGSGAFDALEGGLRVTSGAALAISGCDRLSFAPRLTPTVGGRGFNREGAHPALTVRIDQSEGQSPMRSAVVTLPRTISTNLATVQRSCDPAVHGADQSRCPPESLVATASATSPLIGSALRGPVYLVREPRGLPSLAVRLRGEVSLDLLGKVTIGRGGVIVTTFGTIPDLELSSFTLAFKGGRTGVLTTVGNLCARNRVSGRFDAHSGRSASVSPTLGARGCRAAKVKASAALRFRGGSGTLAVKATAPRGGRAIAAISVALPRTLRAGGATVSAKAGRKRIGRKAIKARGRTVSVRLPRRGARTVTVQVRGVSAGSRRLARRLAARRGALRVRVITRQVGGKRSAGAIRLRLR